MSVGATLLAFLSGSAVGTVAGAALTASHARAERFRDRMLDAAERFLGGRDIASDAIWDFQVAATELLRAKNEATAQAEKSMEALRAWDAAWKAAGEPEEEIPEAFGTALVALEGLEAASGIEDPLRTEARQEARRVVERATDALEGLLQLESGARLEGFPGLTALGAPLRSSLRAQARFIVALPAMGDAATAARKAVAELHASVARLALLFRPHDGQPSEAVGQADEIKERLLAAIQATSDAMKAEEPAIRSDKVLAEVQASNDLAIEFASSVNAAVRRRWRI